MITRGASRESRTVRTFRGSSGAATGYSVPPMLPIIKCPSGISAIAFEGIRSPRSKPVMVLPLIFRDGSIKLAEHLRPRPTAIPGLRT